MPPALAPQVRAGSDPQARGVHGREINDEGCAGPCGTLLVDDLPYMPLAAQASLLRVLDSGQYLRMGDEHDSQVACRIVFATTVPLTELVERGQLIHDLRSRIGEFVIDIPTLAQRADDIPGLVRKFAARFRAERGLAEEIDFSIGAMAALTSYPWPDNLRELDSVARRFKTHRNTIANRISERPPD